MTLPTQSETAATLGRFASQKPTLIINMGAGTASDISRDVISIFRRFNYSEPTVRLAEPGELPEALAAIKTDQTDLLIIFGGDGTCKAGAIAARDAGIPLIALPGGTMNMLPKALYGTDNWRAALELALSQEAPRWQVAGDLNGHIFFCGAIFGDPVIMSEARESLREGDVFDAVKQIPEIISTIAHGERFEFKVDGEIFDRVSNGLQIYCPYMTAEATDPEAFEVVSVPQLSITQMIGIGAKALTQGWRDSAHVMMGFAKHVEINGQGSFDILLDGEPEQVSCPVAVNLEPQGVLVLAPNLNERAE